MAQYEKLTQSELEKKLEELIELLEEVEEERMIILGQENLHISSKVVVKYQNEINGIKEEIETVKGLLADIVTGTEQ
jgi:predicted nuclease with TOPRIM domain